MDQIIAVFTKLGADITFFYQLGLFLIFYIILKTVFFNKLQFILEIRDNKTLKLKDYANKKFEKSYKLEKDYLSRVKSVQARGHEDLRQEKEIILKKRKTLLEEAREDVERNIQRETQIFQKDVDAKKNNIFSHVTEFSNELLEKIGTQG